MNKDLVRSSFSIEKPLYDQLEKMVKENGYTNRSEFIRDMIRKQSIAEEWQRDDEVLGTVTLIFDHHKRELSERLTHIQHHHHSTILASTHIHLDAELCAEMIMMKGLASHINEIVNELKKQRGVLHADLVMSSTGKTINY